MQTYFIQNKKFILVESSICTQSIVNAIQLINTKNCIFLLGRTHRYNPYTFRIGVSVLYLNFMSFASNQMMGKPTHLILSKSSLCKFCKSQIYSFIKLHLDRSVTFIKLSSTSIFCKNWAFSNFQILNLIFIYFDSRMKFRLFVARLSEVVLLLGNRGLWCLVSTSSLRLHESQKRDFW
jgi:hypothetical protein